MREAINDRVKAHERARAEGKLKNVITWILEKDSAPRFSTTVTSDNIVKPLPRDAHNATINHFTQHFSCHPWITASHINDNNEQGEQLRDSLLKGTWRTTHPTLTHSLDLRHRTHAEAYLDNFKFKASPHQRQALLTITSTPITFETFCNSILKRCGTKSPGPSGLTISVLQATPTSILQHLYHTLSVMWNARHVPRSWQARELALLPKKPNSITLSEMRPLMLLEVLRKTWLSLILHPVAVFLNQQNLICPYQVGGIPPNSKCARGRHREGREH